MRIRKHKKPATDSTFPIVQQEIRIQNIPEKQITALLVDIHHSGYQPLSNQIIKYTELVLNPPSMGNGIGSIVRDLVLLTLNPAVVFTR
jgi:hypothetical protein